MTQIPAGDHLHRHNLRRLKIVHCYTSPWDDVPHGTPSPLMIAALDFATDREDVFAVHLTAERRGIPAVEIPQRLLDLEREMLEEFYGLVRSTSRHRWLHWNMGSISYGFPALAQRFCALGGTPVDVPHNRLINLARVLKAALGETYA